MLSFESFDGLHAVVKGDGIECEPIGLFACVVQRGFRDAGNEQGFFFGGGGKGHDEGKTERVEDPTIDLEKEPCIVEKCGWIPDVLRHAPRLAQVGLAAKRCVFAKRLCSAVRFATCVGSKRRMSLRESRIDFPRRPLS